MSVIEKYPIDPRWQEIEEKILNHLLEYFYTHHKIDYSTIDEYGLTKQENERMFINFLKRVDLAGAVEILIQKEFILNESGLILVPNAHSYAFVSPFHGL